MNFLKNILVIICILCLVHVFSKTYRKKQEEPTTPEKRYFTTTNVLLVILGFLILLCSMDLFGIIKIPVFDYFNNKQLQKGGSLPNPPVARIYPQYNDISQPISTIQNEISRLLV